MVDILHERLLEALDYDPATGIFRWKIRTSNRTHIGDRAGVVTGSGYRFITLDRQKLQATRLAWFYVHREWPKGDIKSQNGDLDDCSIANLRDVSRLESARERGAPSTNTSGVRGVSPTSRGKWKAAVTANYRQVMLGVFDNKEQASEVYEHAMAVLAGAKTPEECESALDKIIQHRRCRVAWNRLVTSGRRHSWVSFEAFREDVGRIEEDESTVAAVDGARPIGAGNFRWLLRPQGKFDRSTKEGRAAYARAYRDVNPGRWRHTHLNKNYGIDEVGYQRLLKEQNGLCAICGEPETKFRGAELRVLSVDHDHENGKARGILCGNCNQGIGMFGNNRPDLLRAAADYLDRHQDRSDVASDFAKLTPVYYRYVRIPREYAGHG